jgi:hypothetical protein
MEGRAISGRHLQWLGKKFVSTHPGRTNIATINASSNFRLMEASEKKGFVTIIVQVFELCES